MQNTHNAFIIIIREIGFVVIGILKIPLILLGYILGFPLILLSITSEFGRGGHNPQYNYFGRLVNKLWHLN